ncbi:hypothetical protein [Haloferax mucosum]|uniref:hypothetical protein n=1 Tax=Haloferax mucosum TaxID=403181 RepID=UPI00032659E3|nr:hypothetical protein [Haloferax mucosum]
MFRRTTTAPTRTRVRSLAACLAVVCLVAAAPVALAATATSVGFESGSATVEPGATTTVDVVVSDVDAGVGAYNLTVSLENESVGRLSEVTMADGERIAPRNISYRDNRTTATLSSIGLDTDDTGSVAIASVTIEAADSTGDSALDIDVSSLGNEDGNPYTVTKTTGLDLSVSESDGSSGGGGGSSGGGGGGNSGGGNDDSGSNDGGSDDGADGDSQTKTANSPTPTESTATESATPTTEPTATPTQDTETEEPATGTGVPGFGVVSALVAAGAFGLQRAARRRR